MRVIADLHIHSRFSRACSKELTLPNIAMWCGKKGIDLVSTGDFTHPQWRGEIGEGLVECADGIFALKNEAPHWTKERSTIVSDPKLSVLQSFSSPSDQGSPSFSSSVLRTTRFLLGTELSCIYKHDGKVRRVHHLVFAPSLAAVDRIRAALEARGCNLRADGRPILGLSSHDLLTICLEADPRTLLIPAHAWTPWFAVFGSESGYDSLEECFGDLTEHVPAIETGLSSDPAMNWRVSALDRVALVSSSDAHSLPNLGREATVLELEALTFDHVARAIRASAPVRFDAVAPNRIIETIEFFPEEGKYHYDGHRACGVRLTPAETKRHRRICPRCAKPLTVGVMHRVDVVADRPEGFTPRAPTYRRIVPLAEVIAEAFDSTTATKRVAACYEELIARVGNEFHVLLDAPLEAIARVAPPEVAEAIRRVRASEIDIAPGYDGEYGTVSLFTDARPRPVAKQHALL
ncbi:DNA helicase UvrD [Candidatus Uhrbacteria bacterium]|nr:DNA helicase UvrD [Candidatus Uhrbacteria bacterium]